MIAAPRVSMCINLPVCRVTNSVFPLLKKLCLENTHLGTRPRGISTCILLEGCSCASRVLFVASE